MPERLKVMTIVGTRPEVIRLSRVIKALDKYTDHVLVHTGQNYDFALNQVFFDDLELREPDHFLGVDTTSLGSVLADVLRGTEDVISREKPDAMVVLGDTNSCIAALMGRRLRVPVYHLEAGNRSFDPNVPEEINRHLVDHVSDYNLVYTEHSRRNLLREGIHPSRILLMGSPMNEVLNHYRSQADGSQVLHRLGLKPKEFILASAHREENVDRLDRLELVLESLAAASKHLDLPVLLSTHPRTRSRLDRFKLEAHSDIVLHPPLGFHDYIKLQLEARIVISDSGTIAEESAILGFPAVTLRDTTERPEAFDTGGIIATGLNPSSVVDALDMVLAQHEEPGERRVPVDYTIVNSSQRVVNWIRSTAGTHNLRTGVRVTDA